MLRLLLAAVVLAGCAGTRVVDRTADGAPILICGPQPDRATLARYHVKTVVNLRGEAPDKRWFRKEARAVKAVGAKWIHLRTTSHEPPSAEHVERFLAIVTDRANWPVLVHCQSGMHRTGLMCAFYRMEVQGWTGEQALEEMVRHGFRIGADRHRVEEYVRNYR